MSARPYLGAFLTVALGVAIIDNPRWITAESDRPFAWTENATTIDGYSAGWNNERYTFRGVPLANGGNHWDRPGGVVRLGLDPCGWYVITAISPAGVVESVHVPSPLDYNADDRVDSGDFFEFLQLFFAGMDEADYDANGVVDSGDMFAFVNAWSNCP